MAWLVGYSHRKQGAVNATTAGAQTLYQLKLIVGESSGASGCGVHCENHCLDFPNDIRFTKEDGETKHDYWVQEITGTTPNRKATVWIEVTVIPASGSVDFFIYYRKTSDGGESNGSNSFLFFDDFESGNLNKWDIVEARWGVSTTTVKSGTYSAECDVVQYEQAGRCLRKNLSDWGNMVLELDFRISQWTGTPCHKGLIPGASEVNPSGKFWGPGMINPHDGPGGIDSKELKFRRGASPPYYHDYPNGKIITLNTWMHVAYYVNYDTSKQNTYVDDFNLGEIDLLTYDGTTIDSSMYIERIKMQGSGGWTSGHDYLWIDNVFIRKFTSPSPTWDSWGAETPTFYTKTFAADGYLVNNETKTFTCDVALEKSYTKAFTVDTLISKAYTQTFSMDAHLSESKTKPFSVDVILSGPETRTFTCDAFILNRYTKTFDVDAVLSGSIAGITRDSNGDALGNCTVWLFKTSDKSYVDMTTSNGSGEYTFDSILTGVYYFIRSHKDGSPNVFGTTDDNLEAS